MLHITEAEVRRLLPMETAIALVEAAFLHLAQGKAGNDPRRRLQLGSSAMLHYMAAVDTAGGYLGAKLYTTHPKTGAHFTVLLYAADGRPLASVEANALGQIRTGAASGVATRLLARENSTVAGVIGAGFQAWTQLEAAALARPLKKARVYSRSAERREEFARMASARLGLAVSAAGSAEQAVEGADIVITATSSKEPVLAGQWLAPGMHINAVGSNHRARRELDTLAVNRASLIVADSVEQAKMESGDLLAAFAEEPRSWQDVAELADLVAGKEPRRQSEYDITLFKSNGIALEDIAVAGYIYEQAQLKKG